MVLRQRPLGQVPVVDTFGKIDTYHAVKRKPLESMPDYIVREEEAFSELRAAAVGGDFTRSARPENSMWTNQPSR